ncbi:hypothetical protein HUU05_06245 [candidate division KSB1 bacterium]|nr:hypothetical protein [candidate division KSB1 bacterium]
MRKFLLYVALVLWWNLALAGEKEVTSQWRATEIKVDGAGDEWAESIFYLEKEKLAFGVKNDSSALYLLLKFDRSLKRQAISHGCTIWFDPTGKNKKTFGVRYPIGMMNFGGRAMPESRPAFEDESAPTPFGGAMLREIEVLGPEKDERNRFVAGSSFGIEAAAFNAPDELVCEVKIPLHGVPGRPYAINADTGESLSLGFELGEFEREKIRDRMGRESGKPGGGFPRGARPPGGFRGGTPPGAREPMPSGFKVWQRLQLASFAAQISNAAGNLDGIFVTLTKHEMPLREALQQIVSQTKLQIVYSDALVQDVKVHCACEEVTARTALAELLRSTALVYEITADGQIVIVKRDFKP